jgi:hypothetical protein
LLPETIIIQFCRLDTTKKTALSKPLKNPQKCAAVHPAAGDVADFKLDNTIVRKIAAEKPHFVGTIELIDHPGKATPIYAKRSGSVIITTLSAQTKPLGTAANLRHGNTVPVPGCRLFQILKRLLIIRYIRLTLLCYLIKPHGLNKK